MWLKGGAVWSHCLCHILSTAVHALSITSATQLLHPSTLQLIHSSISPFSHPRMSAHHRMSDILLFSAFAVLALYHTIN